MKSSSSPRPWLWGGYTALSVLALASVTASVFTGSARSQEAAATAAPESVPLVTGKYLSGGEGHIPVGSYPSRALLSPDGKWVIISSLGFRSSLHILDSTTGSVVSQVDFTASSAQDKSKKEGLFHGVAFGPARPDGATTVYASRGSDDRITVLSLAGDGTLTRLEQELLTPGDKTSKGDTGRPQPVPFHVAGIATNRAGTVLYAVSNVLDPAAPTTSTLYRVNAQTGEITAKVTLPAYPFAVAALTSGAHADRKLYVTSEQQGTVSVVDTSGTTPTLVKTLAVGAGATGLTLNRAQNRLYVSSTLGDTVSIIDTDRDKVTKTILLRPANLRGLPAVTPQGLTLSPDEKTLYVAVSDLNAVAVVDIEKGSVRGYLPTGWYPTDVAVSPDGARLFVTCAKGTTIRNPNGTPKEGIARADRPQYTQNIIGGTVGVINLATALPTLASATSEVLKNNRLTPDLPKLARQSLKNPGIEHVIYIIKENRTYDQVLGDMPQGNGDPSLVLFGRDVTPNQHALAERFALLDNFYCCAEVSGDGWNWSTQGMVSAYNSRNVVYGYTGKTRAYEYEGTNTGVAVDLKNIPDVSQTAGGYIWDNCARNRVSFRNYGFFADDEAAPRLTAEDGTMGGAVTPSKKALTPKTSRDFREYDLNYADSEAWVKHNLPPVAGQLTAYGKYRAPSRITAWREDFNEMLRANKVPRFLMVRLGRDHTSGTRIGASSPRAMVAENDYAVGQLVEAVSNSPLWGKTAIFILEDDAQNGYDHVDAHRSIAFVISPFVRQGTKDSRFYNTDSFLHTMENLLGLPPMNHYDATAPTVNIFAAQPVNAAPYTAILPAKALIGEVNSRTAYRALDSQRLINPRQEESDADEQLNDILWHSIKGRVPAPARRHGLQAAGITPKRDE